MTFNLTEAESGGTITSYEDKPNWWETVKASYINEESTNRILSANNYFADSYDSEIESYQEDMKPESYHIMKNRITRVELDNYEKMYANGDIEKIQSSGRWGNVYLEFKNIEGSKERKSVGFLLEEGKQNSLKDYKDSKEILDSSDSWSAKMVGAMGSLASDPFFLITLPFGGSVATGGTITQNAVRAFLTEGALEGVIQGIERPASYEYKKELGIKTSVPQEAANAVMNVTGAGLFRAAGSATWDLTESGIKALRAKDPELADEYQRLSDSQATDNMKEHTENLNRVDMGEEVSNIVNPNEKGAELNSASPIPEVTPEMKITALETDDLKVHSGVDEQGESIYKTYNELQEEVDIEAEQLRRVEECLL